MRGVWIIAAALLALGSGLGASERVVSGLSQNRVAITANFDGSEILVFGAVGREAPAPVEDGPLDVIVEVTGPSNPVTVRRKERVLGIWANRDAVDVNLAPSFYSLATTGPLDEVISPAEQLRYGVGTDQVVRVAGPPPEVADTSSFTDALVRIRTRDGLYSESGEGVELTEETLFRTDIALPANLVEGDYRTRIFLARGGEVVDVSERVIAVRKSGLERWIYNLAHEQPLLYGLLSLAVALLAGWGASEAFRLLRR
ncbi:TIGR02186 family protein [Oceanomicrobium pacificus]|uniref:TIGR02186 family protein n=1 Tax=Oceanomicrobium pacificus TaxID=2692916 RepID=A0A6B0TU53_9RHOB|nr:TIGR02186 family protein [Oceanomicrobium pacificus]MXU64493.1 hypothetical protein [Oceanomicrobium pacificus]